MMDFRVIILLCLLLLLAVPQLATLALLVRRRHLQPIRYRGVWLIVLSGAATFIAFVWYMLFLMLEVSGMDDAPHGQPRGTRRYFCGSWQWILWIANACIIGGYGLRSLRIIKVHTQRENKLQWDRSCSLASHAAVLAGSRRATRESCAVTARLPSSSLLPLPRVKFILVPHPIRSTLCSNDSTHVIALSIDCALPV